MNVTKSDGQTLLSVLVEMGSSGIAESNPEGLNLLRFLPLSDHARILDPESSLIIGNRGAGKSQLFLALQHKEGREAIVRASGRFEIGDLDKTRWVVGYSTAGTDFPAPLIFREFAAKKKPIDLQSVWLAYLLRCLNQSDILAFGLSNRDLLEPLQDFLREDVAVDIEAVHRAVNANLQVAFSALDSLDRNLARAEQRLFVTYDDLDRVCSSDWEQLAKVIQGLIQFWAANARRWRHIRPKIFLRRDLYTRSAIVGPDVSKISAQRLELTWSVRDLYALLSKRFVNQNRQLAEIYLDSVLPRGEDRGALGWFPLETDKDSYRPMIQRMCGENMGATSSKGRTFTWITTHLQDAHGEVLPRSFVRLFEKAASLEMQNSRAEWPNLLHHSSLRGALDRVSVDRMEEFKEELPWIERVRQVLKEANLQVPNDRQTLQRVLKISWEGETERPPFQSGYDLLQYLGELGIFYLRDDKRVDVRDIYLSGLGLKRKGGVKKPF